MNRTPEEQAGYERIMALTGAREKLQAAMNEAYDAYYAAEEAANRAYAEATGTPPESRPE